MAKKQTVEEGLLQLDPAIILADDNTRFNLKDSRITSLAQSIVDQNGVMEPVEVEPIDNENGFKYRLTTGYYRLAAVKHLNISGAGLTIPALVHRNTDATERLKRQLVENMERENQSPMDMAIAIDKLFKAEVSRADIRTMFARPGRGKKGEKEPMASNSFINMMRSFLDLPKAVQEGLHSGKITVSAGYQLTKIKDKDEMKAILAKIEEERQKDIDREEKDEERLLATEKKEQEVEAKSALLAETLARTEAVNKQAHDYLKVATDRALEAYKASKAKYDTVNERKAAATAFKEAEKNRAVAEADAHTSQVLYEKAVKASASFAESQAKKSTQESAPTKKEKVAKVTDKDVTDAAQATGASTGPVKLALAEIREGITDLSLPGGNEKVMNIGKAFKSFIDGVITDKELYRTLVKIVS